MRKEELLKQLKSVKAPEPDEETVLQSEEELIRRVRSSFSQIVQERRVIYMKNRRKVVFATVAVVIAAVILSAVIVPTIKVANAKQVAQNVIEDTLHLKVDGKDITVEGDVATAIINGLKINVDTSKAIIIDVVRAESTSLTEEEKNKAIEIFRNSPEVKSTLEEQGNVNPSNAEILEIKGLAFPDGRKYVWVKVKVNSPNGDAAGGIVDLQKGKASVDVIGPSDSVVAPGIEDYIPEAPAP